MTTWLETTQMPSNRKKRVRARMAKTGERYETALRHLRAEEAQDHAAKAPTFVPPKPGEYTGTPCLPPVAPTMYVQGDYVLPDDLSRPVVEMVNIQGDYDTNDLHRAWVPSTAFDDPAVPPGTKRVLSLGEYLDARAKQSGWRLERITPGPRQTFEILGTVMNVMLYVIVTWQR
jgi:hypothetical protein